MGMFWGLLKFQIFLGCLKFLIFFGRRVDAGPGPTYEEKTRVSPPHTHTPWDVEVFCTPLLDFVR